MYVEVRTATSNTNTHVGSFLPFYFLLNEGMGSQWSREGQTHDGETDMVPKKPWARLADQDTDIELQWEQDIKMYVLNLWEMALLC